MKIGFVVHMFDFRNDVRRLINEAAQHHEVVVFGSAQDEAAIKGMLTSSVTYRCIEERIDSVTNNLLIRAYLLFRRIPLSEDNYWLMQWFLASNAKNGERARAERLYRLERKMPKWLSYDAYLHRLQYAARTFLDDIDQFILFTQISDDYLLARLLAESRPAKVYVYSWDHPCKHTRFSKRLAYACWSDGLRDDLVHLQGIQREQIRVVGASQFTYIHDFLAQPPSQAERQYDFPYVYFGCAIGIKSMVADEIAVIRSVAEVLATARPNWKLVVRPYPVLRDWGYYNELQGLANVVIEEDFRQDGMAVATDAIRQKYVNIHFAEAFMHLGTTMGLEAAFTKTPSFLLDFGYHTTEGLSLYNFIHQYQNDKYLVDPAPQNVINSPAALTEVFNKLDQPDYESGNRAVSQQYSIISMETFVTQLIGN